MQSYEYAAMYELEESYWWFIARRRLVEELVRNEKARWNQQLRILDVGCGTGANLAMLSRYGDASGVDRSPTAVNFCLERRRITTVLESGVEQLPAEDGSFQLITVLDVLEHTDNDLIALKELHRVCAPKGLVLITVPAYGFLWSEHDEALHHRRRYTAHELRNKLTVAGFNVERTTYFISALFFPILMFRIYQGIFKHSVEPKTSLRRLPKWLNSVFVGIIGIEQFFLQFINLPFGVSIVALARPDKTQ